jgi:hypothetical protein
VIGPSLLGTATVLLVLQELARHHASRLRSAPIEG